MLANKIYHEYFALICQQCCKFFLLMKKGRQLLRLRSLGTIGRPALASASDVSIATIQRVEEDDDRVTEATFEKLFNTLADAGLTLGRRAGVYNVDEKKLEAWKAARKGGGPAGS